MGDYYIFLLLTLLTFVIFFSSVRANWKENTPKSYFVHVYISRIRGQAERWTICTYHLLQSNWFRSFVDSITRVYRIVISIFTRHSQRTHTYYTRHTHIENIRTAHSVWCMGSRQNCVDTQTQPVDFCITCGRWYTQVTLKQLLMDFEMWIVNE